jgi:hypothetical protein
MIRKLIKKLLAPIVREVLKEELNKSELVTDQLLNILKSQSF